MTTAYVAAERFIHWNAKGQLEIDEQLATAIASHRRNNRFIIFFAPARFGLLFDDRRDVEEAWDYLSAALRAFGMVPDGVMLFDHDVNVAEFLRDMECHTNEEALIVSDDTRDEVLGHALGIRCIHDVPANISGVWQKLSIRRILRTLVAAAFSA